MYVSKITFNFGNYSRGGKKSIVPRQGEEEEEQGDDKFAHLPVKWV